MVYEYTKPRGPIMAMYSSPGPCYALPGLLGQDSKIQPHDPRSVHYKGPAYSFGLKHGKFADNCSPGPQAYSFPNSSTKVYRTGRDGTPHYSMTFRPRSVDLARTPGPLDYSRERGDKQSFHSAPAYTMAYRNKARRLDKTPAPNTYNADSMFGRTIRAGKIQAPCYSMVGKQYLGSFYEDQAKTPGPSVYKATEVDSYKRRAPGYTITGKNFPPSAPPFKAGPGSYNHDNLGTVKRNAPKFTFGLRHSQYEAPLILEPTD